MASVYTSEIYPKTQIVIIIIIGLVSSGCFNVINSYPPFASHARNGIDNLPLHPFALLLVEVPVKTNDHQFDRNSDICFFGLGTWVKYKTKYCYATDFGLRWIWAPEPKNRHSFGGVPISQNEQP